MAGLDDFPELPSDADDDEALRYAIALSLRESQGDSAQKPKDGSENNPTELDSSANKDKVDEKNKATFGSIALDRKAMEEERLKRLAAKRPRPTEDDDDDVVEVAPPAKRPTPVPASRPSTQKAPASMSGLSTTGGQGSKPTAPVSSFRSTAKRGALLQFPDGAVKKTWAYGHPRTDEDIKIEEVLQKDQLELAVLSSFQWDDEWLMSKFDIPRTKLLLVAYAAGQEQQAAMRANAPPNVRFCFPPMEGRGAMHSKLQLLKYPGSMRIVVPTGNLVSYDWGETGVMENMVFIIDLPLLKDTPTAATKDERPTAFFTELSRFLGATGIDDSMIRSLSRYDFSRTAKLGFVYTIPGSHTDELRRKTGYCGLGDTVAGLGLATGSEAVDVDIVAASLGSINQDLIGALYNACQGDNGMKEYAERTSRKRGQKPSDAVPQRLKDHVRIYFPTERTVANSRGGRGAAGTICVQARWWRSPSFPTDLVRDCENVRDGLLMHSKMMFVRASASSATARPSVSSADPGFTATGVGGAASGSASAEGRQQRRVAWAYVGSANLSESAWGRLVKDSKTGKPKMTCRNWECGVVIPVETATDAGSSSETGTGSRSEADWIRTLTTPGTAGGDGGGGGGAVPVSVPVPMRVPGRRYGPNEEPWFYAGSS